MEIEVQQAKRKTSKVREELCLVRLCHKNQTIADSSWHEIIYYISSLLFRNTKYYYSFCQNKMYFMFSFSISPYSGFISCQGLHISGLLAG